MATTVLIGDFSQEDPVISADGRFVVLDDFPQVLVRELATGELSIVSVSSEGVAGNRTSGGNDAAAISADGRYIAFTSQATNLVPNDTNGERDLFLRDRVEGTTRLISLDSNGNQIPANTFDSALSPSISADGRFVAFQSEATLANDGFEEDIFVRDVVNNTTEVVSVSSDGTNSDSFSTGASISADGRYVAFTSLARNLVDNDTGIDFDVFVRDRTLGTTIMASVNSQGEEASGSDVESEDAVISPDGRYVAFRSTGTNLVPNDTNGVGDIFTHNLETGETTRISVDSNGNQANGGSALSFGKSAISSDGRYITFQSVANNLVEGDTNNALDVFVRDTVEGTTTRVSVNAEGEEPVGGRFGTESFGGTISGDGQRIAFMSNGVNMNDSDIATSLIYLRDLSDSTEEPEDEAPTVNNPVSDINVEEDAENQTIDLSDVFGDADGDEILVAVASNSNPDLVSATIEENNLNLDFLKNQSGTAEITLRGTANGATVDDTFSITVTEEELEPPDNPNEPSEPIIELFRFRNTTFDTGTYIFVGEAERDFILDDENLSNTFALDGVAEDGTVNPAFTASSESGDGLIPFFRLESLTVPGTFLFVSTAEYDFIFNDPIQQEQWKKQGFADEDETEDIPEFYLREGSADSGTAFNRFQNQENGTFLYAAGAESEAIEDNPDLANLFDNQGVAFNSLA